MTLIVDTCNVLHRTGILPPELAGVDEDGLAELVERSRYGRQSVLLVCDGGPGSPAALQRRGNVRYQYSGPSRTADEVIERLIGSSHAPRRLLVVTSDRAVATMAKRRRCKVIDSDTFLGQLAHDSAREAPGQSSGRPQDGPLESGEVEAWLDRFELEEDLREITPAERPQRPPEPAPEPVEGDPPQKDPPSDPAETWEDLSTDELFRRFERGGDAEADRP